MYLCMSKTVIIGKVLKLNGHLLHIVLCCYYDNRPTRIFYGTRTHKQITQITHELARTAYSSTP